MTIRPTSGQVPSCPLKHHPPFPSRDNFGPAHRCPDGDHIADRWALLSKFFFWGGGGVLGFELRALHLLASAVLFEPRPQPFCF
jgi:hypothetical protein